MEFYLDSYNWGNEQADTVDEFVDWILASVVYALCHLLGVCIEK